MWTRALVGSVLLAACADEAAPDADVVAVTELGAMANPAGIEGRDGGVSGRFGDRSVWVYGDGVATIAGTYPNTWRNNTMSWTADLDAADGIDGFVQPTDSEGAAREFFPRTSQEQEFNDAHVDRGDGSCADPCGARYAIWGAGPIADPERDRYLLAYGKVYSEPGPWNFWIVGNSIAVWDDFDAGPARPEVDAALDDPTLLFDAEQDGEFAIPAVHAGDLYLFSCSGRGGGHGCRLARAPLADVLERDAYEFRTDDGWSSASSDAVVLFDGSPNLTVHHSAHLDRWLAVYADFGEIVLRTAEAPEGPWSGTGTIATPDGDAIHAHAHAEYQEAGGAVEYVSYLTDTFHLLRVELAP
ncbi:MAG: DUF4185 domain-containing protein [Myxococcales bacterium]|nr:DUF4185 domain-containing protein [Myxococcales bacterium]